MFFFKNNVNEVVKVVPEYANWPIIPVIYKNSSISTDIFYKSYQGPL